MATTVAAEPHMLWQTAGSVHAEQQQGQQEHEEREPAPDPPVFDEPQPSSAAPARHFLPRPPSTAAHAAAAASVAPTAFARLFAVLLHQLLDGTASLAARLPMPRGGQGSGSAAAPFDHSNRGGGSPGSGPLAPTPAVVAAAAPRSASPAVLGLAPGEIESEEEEEEDDGLTAAELRRLQASPAFQRHIRAKGQTTADLAATASRLRLRLRRADPSAFWMLVSRESRCGLESRLPSRLVLAADYLLSALVNVAVTAALAWALTRPALPLQLGLLVAAATWWLTGAAWAAGRSTAGALFGLWYEEPRWGHLAPAWRCLCANLLELAYLLGSLGLGLPISLALRLAGGRRQCVGELLAGAAAVHEVRVDAAAGCGSGGGKGHAE